MPIHPVIQASDTTDNLLWRNGGLWIYLSTCFIQRKIVFTTLQFEITEHILSDKDEKIQAHKPNLVAMLLCENSLKYTTVSWIFLSTCTTLWKRLRHFRWLDSYPLYSNIREASDWPQIHSAPWQQAQTHSHSHKDLSSVTRRTRSPAGDGLAPQCHEMGVAWKTVHKCAEEIGAASKTKYCTAQYCIQYQHTHKHTLSAHLKWFNLALYLLDAVFRGHQLSLLGSHSLSKLLGFLLVLLQVAQL